MINFADGTWLQLKRHMEMKLEVERKKNDGTDLDERQTYLIRGRISLLKELLALELAEEVRQAQARIEHPD